MHYAQGHRKKIVIQSPLFTNFSELTLIDLKKIKKSKEKYDENIHIYNIEYSKILKENELLKVMYESERTVLTNWWSTIRTPLEKELKRVKYSLEQQRVSLIDKFANASGFFGSDPVKFDSWNLKNDEKTYKLITEYELIKKKLFDAEKSKPKNSFSGRVPTYQKSPNPPRHDQPFTIKGAKVRIDLENLKVSIISNLIEAKIRDEINSKEKVNQLKARAATVEKDTRQQAKKYRSDFEIQKKVIPVCPYCGGALNESDSHLDHIYPVSKGGQSVLRNLVFVCSKCNLKKKTQTLRFFIASLGLEESLIYQRLDKLKKDF
jgi:5-methylcytosine-specific restriction endonuclease McrA